jgi:hypothetical protein
MSRPKTLPETIEKTCPICKRIFSVSYYLRNKRTYCGKKCANADPEVKRKIIESQTKTFTEKYGMHPMKTEQTIQRLKASVMEKHGVEWVSKMDGWYDKVKATKLKLYGDEHYLNHEQQKKTWIKKYGVDNPTKSPDIRERMNENRKTVHYNYLNEYCVQNDLDPLFDREHYNGYGYDNKYKFQCTKCHYIFETAIYNSFGAIFCEKCDPNKKPTFENSFFEFLSSLNPTPLINRHDRTILYGKELDFYLPEQKLAFELNGLYWHSEFGHGLDRRYHLNKTRGCLAHNVRLIHIFENEWRDKLELVKSVIKTILKLQKDTIYARKCEIREVSIKDKDIFLNENHLQQKDKSTVKLGLYYDQKLVSLMTFRKTSRFDKNVEWELSRFCNAMNVIVIGGASKLFQHFLKTYTPKSMVSYNDRRYFSGDLYNALGFKFIGHTSPSYHYITPDYKNTINRLNFQKHLLSKKLSIFDQSLSEWENMKNNGYDRIWDCGCGKWVWTIH